MDKIEEYLDNHMPKVRKMGASGLYEVYSDVNPSICMVGRAGLTKLKDEILMRGLKLTPKEKIEQKG